MTEVLTKLNPGELVGLLWTAGPIFCALVWIILGHVLEYHRVSVAAALKKAMVERGMTADEIVQVLGPPSEALDVLSEGEDDEKGVVNEQCAGEVLVDQAGQWLPALVLRRDGDRYLIHTCPGYGGRVEMSCNEWVKADRLRFAASSSGQDGSPQGLADRTGAFDASPCCSQPKKEPVPAEV